MSLKCISIKILYSRSNFNNSRYNLFVLIFKKDMNEAITCLSSSQWSERRDGLVNLKNMMQSGRVFSRQELKRLCEIFSRLFQDQHNKVRN